MKQQRVQDEYILEQYEPMTTKYWKRNKKPNINLLDCPFASDRQLEDQRFLIEQNRNPRGLEPGKNDKPRSIRIASKVGVSNVIHTKAKVINKIVRETSGVHNYTLVPPLSHEDSKKSSSHESIDPDTHPLMKPYREQSNTNPIMCSFGHRPKSASRTFHPGTMKIRLTKGEIAQPARNGRNGFGLPPSILSKLLHAPKIHHPGEEYEDDMTTNEKSLLSDPHNLFLSNEQILKDSHSLSSIDQIQRGKNERNLNPISRTESFKIGEQSWSTTFPDVPADASLEGLNKSPKKMSKYPKKFENDVNWNNHFHVIEKLSNERFELKKSGIAELKLLPLKERLTRFAAISVRESIPQPFCCEKKLTDSLILNGRAKDPRDLYQLVINEQQHQQGHQHSQKKIPDYNRTENPFYDAEVEEDLKTIQRRYREKEEKKKMKLRKKMIQAAIESIPHVEYRPDDMVIAMAQEEEEDDDEIDNIGEGGKVVYGESGFVSQEGHQIEEITTQTSQPMKSKKKKNRNRTSEEKIEILEQPKSSSIRRRKHPKGSEKILNYQKVYGTTLGPLERLELTKKGNSMAMKSPKRMGMSNDRPPSPVKDDSDPIFSHVMQPFQEYFLNEEEKEKMRKEWEKERNERELKEMGSHSADLEGEETEETGDEGNLHGNGLYGDEENGGEGEEEERYDDSGIL